MPLLSFLKRISSVVLFVAIGLAIFLISLEIANLNKIVLGVRIAGKPIGFKKISEASSILQKEIKNFEVSFRKDENIIKALPENIGFNFLLEKTLKGAYQIGREKNIILGLKNQVLSLFLTKDIPFQYELNEKIFDNFLSAKFGQFEIKPENATIQYREKKGIFETIPHNKGYLIKKDKLLKDLTEVITKLQSRPVIIEFEEIAPEIEEEETLEAKEISQKLVNNAPYFLFYQKEKWEIDRETILKWLEFHPKEFKENKILGVTISEKKVKDFLIQLSPAVNFPPKNAELTIRDGRVTAFSLSLAGRKLKIEENTKKIINSILNYQKEIEFEFLKIEPEITIDSIENFGITSLLGKGISSFAGSPKNRIHNIKTGLAKIQGTLIKPGEEFSFNQTVGQVNEKEGFLPELVIKRDKTTPEPGGGICQVSTTIFRAAMTAGLEILERYPHAFPVVYYSPQGFDATVYFPHPDLRFRNNTPNHLLIQGKIIDTTLIIELYGTNDGRKVIIKGPQEYDKKPDGSMKAKLEREIYLPIGEGKKLELIKKETFYSAYKSPKLYPIEKLE